MTRILLLSDTHAYWDDRYAKYAADCDEIWHVGNIDGADLRRRFPEVLRFRCEEAEVVMKHIGGYPGKYDRSVVAELFRNPPDLFISGHSHILKVMRDTTLNFLHINPGAAGCHGWQRVRTLIRFTVDGATFRDLEVIELGTKEIG